MTYLSRLTKLGMAKESAQGTYVAPTVSVPWNTGTKYVDVTDPLRDESVRANDAVLQGITAGPQQDEWQVDVNAYADIIGHFFVAMGLFDTTTPGVSTTLSAGTSAGATSITTAASIPVGSTVRIVSTAGTDYFISGTPSGAGPYTIPVTTPSGGLTYAHLMSDPVVSTTLHTFKQNRTFSTTWPSYSFTTDDGVDQLGWTGCVANEIALKIDPKGFATLSTKYIGQPSTAESTFSYAASAVQSVPGWAWTVTNAGGSSTRGLTMDITMKRAGEAIHSSNGQQAPREVFAGALEADGAYKVIFENDTDANLFRKYTQTVTTHTLSHPLSLGGEVITITMSKSGYTTFEVDNAQPYLQAQMNLSGINNATDTGVAAVTIANYQTAAY